MYQVIEGSQHFTALEQIIESLKHNICLKDISTHLQTTIDMGGNISFKKPPISHSDQLIDIMNADNELRIEAEAYANEAIGVNRDDIMLNSIHQIIINTYIDGANSKTQI